jgi:hypothetical protein
MKVPGIHAGDAHQEKSSRPDRNMYVLYPHAHPHQSTAWPATRSSVPRTAPARATRCDRLIVRSHGLIAYPTAIAVLRQPLACGFRVATASVLLHSANIAARPGPCTTDTPPR